MTDFSQNEPNKLVDVAESGKGRNQHKRIRIVIYILLLLLLISAGCYAIWRLYFQGWESTEDAYVGGNLIVVSSRQDGVVISYRAENAAFVRTGDIIVELDPTDFLANFEKKKASLADAVRKVGGFFEDVQQKIAKVELEKAKYERAQLDFTARSHLIKTESIPQEEFLHSEADFKVAKASLELAEHELDSSKISLGEGSIVNHPLIQEAKMDVVAAYLALQRCSIKAPASGFIANRNVQVGQTIKAGGPLLAIATLENVWIDANFKENQLENIRIGQPVELTADTYGRNVVYKGIVAGFIPGTGSTFSLLPAQNATGNWIKIVQRVPVRIYLDSENLKTHPLLFGLTMNASVDITDTSGLRLPEHPLQKSESTSIYEIDLKPIEMIIDEIIHKNLQVKSD